jgi:hypothetical protein
MSSDLLAATKKCGGSGVEIHFTSAGDFSKIARFDKTSWQTPDTISASYPNSWLPCGGHQAIH